MFNSLLTHFPKKCVTSFKSSYNVTDFVDVLIFRILSSACFIQGTVGLHLSSTDVFDDIVLI